MCPTTEQFSQNLHKKKIISNFLEYQILFEKFEAIPKSKKENDMFMASVICLYIRL